MKKYLNLILRKILSSRGLDITSKTIIELHDVYSYVEKQRELNIFELFLEKVVASLNEKNQDPFFMQIGANDGVYDDNFNRCIKEFNLKGILVEPLPELFEKLKLNYKDYADTLIFENVAIASDEQKEIQLYTFDKQDEGELVRLDVFTTSDKARLEKVKKNLNLQANIINLTLPATSIESLLNKHNVNSLPIIIIDTEGYDFEILKQINFDKYQPLIIQFEHCNLTPKTRLECYQYMSKKGYNLYLSWKDTIAVLPKEKFDAEIEETDG
ncbi:MAG: FkbM family methyltransferase [Gloeocapsa sp. DLM2.Bin57]|nr:MAG: FkbM family methyltransferase [Gloeocapsa sp. DLM2.Bin57]